MTTDVEGYMLLPYAVEVVPDATTEGDVCYLAKHPELPGCMAHGDTTDEALQNLDDARRLYLTTLLNRGLEVPKPESATTATHMHRQEIIWTPQEPSHPRLEPESPLKPVKVGT